MSWLPRRGRAVPLGAVAPFSPDWRAASVWCFLVWGIFSPSCFNYFCRPLWGEGAGLRTQKRKQQSQWDWIGLCPAGLLGPELLEQRGSILCLPGVCGASEFIVPCDGPTCPFWEASSCEGSKCPNIDLCACVCVYAFRIQVKFCRHCKCSMFLADETSHRSSPWAGSAPHPGKGPVHPTWGQGRCVEMGRVWPCPLCSSPFPRPQVVPMLMLS